MKYARVIGVATLLAAGLTAATAGSEKPAAQSGNVTTKTVSCAPECGFSVSSHDEKEVVAIVKEHARTAHNKSMTDEEVRGMMKTDKPKT